MNTRDQHCRFFTWLFWPLERRSPRTSPTVAKGFTAVKHQREVGTSYFDAVTQTLKGSTGDEQFFNKPKLSVANA